MNARHFLLVVLIIFPSCMLSLTLSLGEAFAVEPIDQGKVDAGKILYQQGRYDEALTTFQQAVSEEKKSAPAHYWLGRAWFALGDYDEALKAFRRTVQLNKNWASGHVGMGIVYARLPNRRLDARNAYRRALKIDPGNADAQYLMGMTYMDLERSGELIGSDRDGRKHFLKAVELNPRTWMRTTNSAGVMIVPTNPRPKKRSPPICSNSVSIRNTVRRCLASPR